MADFYKILKADKLGEPWTPKAPGAKPIQNWWCQVEGQDMDVSVGKQVGNELVPGQHIYGDLKYAKSQKGTEYWKFDSQMVPEGVQRPADSPAQATAQAATTPSTSGIVGDQVPGWFAPYGNMIRFIYDELRKMSDNPGEDLNPKTPKQQVNETQAALNGEDLVPESDPETLEAVNAALGLTDEPKV